MKRPKDFEYAKWLAQYYLSFRMHTKREIADKLRKKEVDERIIKECIEFLEENKYIDDYDYACRYIKDAVNLKKYGRGKITQKLLLKGINNDIINKAFYEIDIDNKPTLLKLIEKRKDSEQQKTINYLRGRGFYYTEIKEALDEFTEQNNSN